ncbi:hypothetical protein VTJ49DRAFT_648 [Mycothermus thermophilus]|uniref:Uncharacterized protein n=1 Tax=Humicola insolens TaxID=85995 RepID=A0ABR3VEG8_HUMIN
MNLGHPKRCCHPSGVRAERGEVAETRTSPDFRQAARGLVIGTHVIGSWCYSNVPFCRSRPPALRVLYADSGRPLDYTISSNNLSLPNGVAAEAASLPGSWLDNPSCFDDPSERHFEGEAISTYHRSHWMSLPTRRQLPAMPDLKKGDPRPRRKFTGAPACMAAGEAAIHPLTHQATNRRVR